ncbi:MAG: HPF/RaiA family ribosome-associated protein [Thermodesulfovibrionales bacterium]
MELQITARTVELDDWLKEEITRRAAKLDGVYQRIIHCRVVVEAPHRHKRDGILYNIRVDMHVPGAVLMVEREPNKDLTAAMRDAFDAARRKLEDYSRQQRGDIKRRVEAPHARVSALFPEDGYGFLTTPDGGEVYFHENSVLNDDFRHLCVGAEVRFAEERGEKGPQASTVALVRK